MSVNFSDINRAINSSWDICSDFTFNNDTLNYVNNFISEYYNRVGIGLLDYPYDNKLRTKLFNELLDLIPEKTCILYVYIINCINDIENKNNSENILINSIFKLQTCKNVEWQKE